MPGRVLFQANATPGTKIPLAVHVRMLTEELSHADKDVSFLSIDKKHSYYPNNDKFPEDKGKFKEFFTIHYPTRKTAHLVTVGCIIRTTKMISKMKKSTDPQHLHSQMAAGELSLHRSRFHQPPCGTHHQQPDQHPPSHHAPNHPPQDSIRRPPNNQDDERRSD